MDSSRFADDTVFDQRVLVEAGADHQVGHRELGGRVPVVPGGVADQGDRASEEHHRDHARRPGDEPLPLQFAVEDGPPSGARSMMCAVSQGGVLLAAATAASHRCPAKTRMILLERAQIRRAREGSHLRNVAPAASGIEVVGIIRLTSQRSLIALELVQQIGGRGDKRGNGALHGARFLLRVPVFGSLIDGSGRFTAENIARATRSALASIRGSAFGGRPRGRFVAVFVVIARLPSWSLAHSTVAAYG